MIRKFYLFPVIFSGFIFFSLPVFGQYQMSYEYLLNLGLQNVSQGQIGEALNYLEKARLICPQTPDAYRQLQILEQKITPYLKSVTAREVSLPSAETNECCLWKDRVSRELNRVIVLEDIKTRQMGSKANMLIYQEDFILEGIKRVADNRRKMQAKILAQEISLKKTGESLRQQREEERRTSDIQAEKAGIEKEFAALSEKYREQEAMIKDLEARLKKVLSKEEEESSLSGVSRADFTALKEENRILSTENDFLRAELKRISERSRRQDALIERLEERIEELSRQTPEEKEAPRSEIMSGEQDDRLALLTRRNTELSAEVKELESELEEVKGELKEAIDREIKLRPILYKLKKQLQEGSANPYQLQRLKAENENLSRENKVLKERLKEALATLESTASQD
ncbi:MAG: hypothetical protein GF375_01960 [Candidatus Omnitrophica bacterium]|nr:hypothetical protein [Candidatus Omnitrophota bacterium]MBD3268889.1 hypothetical protein [Candidatus Omnitrophota bacterium]